MSSHEDKLATLRAAFPSKLPYCNGVYSSPSLDFTLFYGKDVQASRLDLSKASPSELDNLLKFSSPMGELEQHDFAAKFDLKGSGIVDIVRLELLEGADDEKEVEAKLYKLNVYGEGASFQARKDMPSSNLDQVFGTLIIVFPTFHDGGALHLHHNDQQWSFDAATIFRNSGPTVGYIAFKPDVKHDMAKITQGHRVTLTYHLYFSSPKPKDSGLIPSNGSDVLKTALSKMVADPEFLPDGGILGFGLHHKYKFKKGDDYQRDLYLSTVKDGDKGNVNMFTRRNQLDDVLHHLNGIDALVVQIARELSLPVSLKVIYETDDPDNGRFLSDSIIDITEYGFSQFTTGLVEMLQANFNLQRTSCPRRECNDDDMEEDYDEETPISWVTNLTNFNEVTTSCSAFDHKRTCTYEIYGSVFLSIVLESASKRGVA